MVEMLLLLLLLFPTAVCPGVAGVSLWTEANMIEVLEVGGVADHVFR